MRIYPEGIPLFIEWYVCSREMNLHVGARKLMLWCGIDRRLHLLRRLVASSCPSCVVAALAASHTVVQRDITSWRESIPLDNTFWPCKETSSQGKTAYLIAETPKRPCHGQLWIFLHALIAALQPRASVLHEADNC